MRDGMLEMVIQFAEASEDPIESPVTLVVGGLLVSGHIVSRDKFVQANVITAQIQKAVDDYNKENPATEEPEDIGNREYIHLRDVQYFSPGQAPIPSSGSVMCRFKLEDVSGFHFGYLATSKPD